jgi:hypothetical protein
MKPFLETFQTVRDDQRFFQFDLFVCLRPNLCLLVISQVIEILNLRESGVKSGVEVMP